VRRLAGAHDPAGLGQLHGRGISENPLDGETKVLSRKKCGAREYRHGRCREGRGAGPTPTTDDGRDGNDTVLRSFLFRGCLYRRWTGRLRYSRYPRWG